MSVERSLHQLDLNLLLPLDALLTERHVTRAAARLHLGQSGMSAALSRLRRFFDDELLVRNGNALDLTPLAQALVSPVREAITSVERLLTTRPHFDPAVDSRTFRVIASDYMTLVLLRPLLARLFADAPSVSVDITPISAGYATTLRRALVDLLVLPAEILEAPLEDMQHQELFTDRYVCAVGRDNPRVVGDRFTVEMLSELPYLACSQNSVLSYADTQLNELHIPRTTAMSTQNFIMAPFLLPGTPMYTLALQRLVDRPEYAAVRTADPPVPIRPITETMYWHPGFEHDPAHRWLRERLSALASEV
jgi:DNA-binding transcriptional LysR family regulator